MNDISGIEIDSPEMQGILALRAAGASIYEIADKTRFSAPRVNSLLTAKNEKGSNMLTPAQATQELKDQGVEVQGLTDVKHEDNPKEELQLATEAYELAKNQSDELISMKQKIRERIMVILTEANTIRTSVTTRAGNVYMITRRTATTETVTKEGKSFIKVHCIPELMDSLILKNEREVLSIKKEYSPTQ